MYKPRYPRPSKNFTDVARLLEFDRHAPPTKEVPDSVRAGAMEHLRDPNYLKREKWENVLAIAKIIGLDLSSLAPGIVEGIRRLAKA